MNKKEMENFLKLMFTYYYRDINENENEEIASFFLGTLNDRFTRYIVEERRKDNFFELVGIEYFLMKNMVYIIKGNEKIGVCDGDIILNGKGVLEEREDAFTILRKRKVINIPIPHLDICKIEKAFFIRKTSRNVYIRIEEFNARIIEDLKTINADKRTLIIDLRNNMGGSLVMANKFLELFVEKNRILYYLKKRGKSHIKFYQKANTLYIKVIVL